MPLCDTLLRLAEEPAFYLPRWSSETLTEVYRNLLKWGYSDSQVKRRITTMQAMFEDAEVDGYQCLVDSMKNHPGASTRLPLPCAPAHMRSSQITSSIFRWMPSSLMVWS